MPTFTMKIIIDLLNRFFTPLIKHVDDGADKVAKAVEKVPKEISDAVRAGSADSARTLTVAVSRVEAAINKIKEPKFSGIVKVDNSDVKRELQNVAEEIRKLPKETSDIDLEVVEDKLDELYECIEKKIPEQTDAIIKALAKVAEALSGIKMNVPKNFSLEERQFLTLSNAMSSGVGVSAPLNMATRISNTTVSAALTGTQYSYEFPSGTVAWLIKLRDQGTLSYYSWTNGTLPNSGTGTAYMTIPQNFLRSQENVEYGGKTIYLGAENAGQVFEIEVFRR